MDITGRFPNRAAFDSYWNEHYIPLTYEDVRGSYEAFAESAGGGIYNSDYAGSGCISKATFKENLSQEARFLFEDSLTEAFYERNPELYETAFALYEHSQLSGEGPSDTAQTFHEVFHALYEAFLDQLFDEKLSAYAPQTGG